MRSGRAFAAFLAPLAFFALFAWLSLTSITSSSLEVMPSETLQEVVGDGWCIDDRLCELADQCRRMGLQLDRIETALEARAEVLSAEPPREEIPREPETQWPPALLFASTPRDAAPSPREWIPRARGATRSGASRLD